MSKDDKPINSPRDYDRSAAEQVEKKPKERESPQQEHDNEDQG